MQKCIITGFFVVVMTISLHAMDFEQIISINNYGSLAENALYSIRGQEGALYKPIKQVQAYQGIPFSSLSLRDIRQHFCAMSDNCKRAIIKTMSTQLLLLACVATLLPEDLVKDHIGLFVFDGHKGAAEKFYKIPLLEHFELYHDIKLRLADDTKPIGPLYVASQLERLVILRVEAPFNFDGQKAIDEMDNELRAMYLQGETEIVLKPDLCDPRYLLIPSAICVCGSCVGFGLMQVAMTVLTCCSCAKAWSCPLPLMSGVGGIVMGSLFGVTTLCIFCGKGQYKLKR